MRKSHWIRHRALPPLKRPAIVQRSVADTHRVADLYSIPLCYLTGSSSRSFQNVGQCYPSLARVQLVPQRDQQIPSPRIHQSSTPPHRTSPPPPLRLSRSSLPPDIPHPGLLSSKTNSSSIIAIMTNTDLHHLPRLLLKSALLSRFCRYGSFSRRGVVQHDAVDSLAARGFQNLDAVEGQAAPAAGFHHGFFGSPAMLY